MIRLEVAPPAIRVDDHELRESERTSLNRLCTISDWQAWGPLSLIMNKLNDSVTIHRVSWEYAMAISGLEQLGALLRRSRALCVGAGSQRVVFHLANHVQHVTAADRYEGTNGSGLPDMLTNPAAYAPFPFRSARLKVVNMHPAELMFPDNEFDFVLGLSTLDTVAEPEAQERCLNEMRRVVRPGGKIVLSVNYVLNGASSPTAFSYDRVSSLLLNHPGLTLVGGDLDLRIAASLVDHPIRLDVAKNVNVAPHIVLQTGNFLTTSLVLFLEKNDIQT